MGGIKKALNKVTGRDAKKEAERQAREAEQRAAEQAKMQAEIDAAQKAGLSNASNAGAAENTTEVEAQKASAKKKNIRGGRKGLTVARSGGSGINI